MRSDVLVVLVHGFCRGGKDMQFWRDNLQDEFANIICADLPACYSSFERCLECLKETVCLPAESLRPFTTSVVIVTPAASGVPFPPDA